jgi:integrase
LVARGLSADVHACLLSKRARFSVTATTSYLPNRARGSSALTASCRVSRLAGVRVTAHSMRRTFTNTCLKLGIEMWKTEMLTSHVPTTTILLHYTDTADLRESCAGDVQ